MTQCKDCLEYKPRIRSNRRRQLNRYYYVNEKGQLWNGKQCAQCKGYTASGHRAELSTHVEEFDNAYIYS